MINESINRPNLLYRGLHLSREEFEKHDFLRNDLIVPYEPLIDQFGRKTVLDGNEYGVYMTTNKNMALGVYGNARNGTIIFPGIYIGQYNMLIEEPDIGITYEINTDNIAIRQPWITDILEGHYNNGFEGEEWIADFIPSSEYRIIKINIAGDILHEQEEIDVNTDFDNIREKIIKKIQNRRSRLVSFAQEVSKLSTIERRHIDYLKLEIYKKLFGENGIAYAEVDSIDTKTNEGIIDYLMLLIYNQDNENINYLVLEYLQKLNQRLILSNKENNLDIERLIVEDIQKNTEMQNKFIERATAEGRPISTVNFEKKDVMLKSLLTYLSEMNNKTK